MCKSFDPFDTYLKMTTQSIGNTGERLAAVFLENLGYLVLERNYRFEHAEIDLVCMDPQSGPTGEGELVFVEVKTRHSTEYGRPEDAVTASKQRQIVRVAQAYLYEKRLERARCRFDVVSILFEHGKPAIEHFKNAFWSTSR